jgi:hypothetical protein
MCEGCNCEGRSTQCPSDSMWNSANCTASFQASRYILGSMSSCSSYNHKWAEVRRKSSQEWILSGLRLVAGPSQRQSLVWASSAAWAPAACPAASSTWACMSPGVVHLSCLPPSLSPPPTHNFTHTLFQAHAQKDNNGQRLTVLTPSTLYPCPGPIGSPERCARTLAPPGPR